MKHSRHRRKPRAVPIIRAPSAAVVFAVALVLLCGAATVPLGSAGMTSWALAIAGCFLCIAFGLVVSRGPEGNESSEGFGETGPVWIAVGLLLWALLQTVSWPLAIVSRLAPGAAAFYQHLVSADGGAAIALDTARARGALGQWIAYGLLGWVCVRGLRSRTAIRVLMFGIAGLGTLQALAAILSGGSPFSWYIVWGDAKGTFSSGNALGGFLAMTLVITAALVLSVAVRLVDGIRGRNLRVVLLEVASRYEFLAIPLLSVAVAAQAVALSLSRSRGALIASSLAVTVLCVWFLLARRGRERNRFLRVLAGSVLLAVAAGALGGYLLSARGFGGETRPIADLPRVTIWRALPDMLRAHPLGVGLGCFGEGFSRFLPAGGFGMRRVYHAHNDYLELLCELGIPGAILLLAAVFLMMRRVVHVILGPSEGSSVWLWRGAALAVATGMMHALVDFNVTSRPGVALVLVVLLGVAMRQLALRVSLGGAETVSTRAIPPVFLPSPKGSRSLAKEDSSPVVAAGGPVTVDEDDLREPLSTGTESTAMAMSSPILRRFSIGARRLLPVLCLVAAVCYGRIAVCSRFLERGRQAVAGSPGLYAWPVGETSREQGEVLLERAKKCGATRAQAFYWSGVGRVLGYHQRREQAIEAFITASPELTRSQATALVNATSGPMAQETYAASCGDLRKAARLMPWNADAHAMLGRYASSMAACVTLPEQAAALRAEAMEQAEFAVSLAPNIPVTLSRACTAVSMLSMDDMAGYEMVRERVRQWGVRALRQSTDVTDDVLAAFHRAGIQLDDLAAQPGIPLQTIARVAKMIAEEGEGERCLRVLAHLETKARAAFSTAANTDAERHSIEGFLNMAQRETDRWLLRMGQWETYRGRESERSQLYVRTTDRRIGEEGGERGPEDMRFKVLATVYEQYGLDSRGTVLLAGMAACLGKPAVATRLLCEMALGDRPVPLVLGEEAENALSCVDAEDVGYGLFSARRMMDAGQNSEAMANLQSFAIGDRLPSTMRHRLFLMLARNAEPTVDPIDSRGTFLREALALCPFDKDVLNAVREGGMGSQPSVFTTEAGLQSVSDLLAAQQVSCEIRMQFLGGRVELLGFDLVERKGRDNGPLLRLAWRFFGQVPARLNFRVICTEDNGDSAFSCRFAFAEQHADVFRGGDPCVGAVVVSTVPMRPGALTSRNLRVGLLLQNPEWCWLPDASDLSYLEINDWQKYIRSVPDAR